MGAPVQIEQLRRRQGRIRELDARQLGENGLRGLAGGVQLVDLPGTDLLTGDQPIHDLGLLLGLGNTGALLHEQRRGGVKHLAFRVGDLAYLGLGLHLLYRRRGSGRRLLYIIIGFRDNRVNRRHRIRGLRLSGYGGDLLLTLCGDQRRPLRGNHPGTGGQCPGGSRSRRTVGEISRHLSVDAVQEAVDRAHFILRAYQVHTVNRLSQLLHTVHHAGRALCLLLGGPGLHDLLHLFIPLLYLTVEVLRVCLVLLGRLRQTKCGVDRAERKAHNEIGPNLIPVRLIVIIRDGLGELTHTGVACGAAHTGNALRQDVR